MAQSTYETGPQSVEVAEDILPFLRETLIGHKVGDRVVLLTSAEEAYGEAGNPTIGIGNKDSVLAIVDILDRVRDGAAPRRSAGRGQEARRLGADA